MKKKFRKNYYSLDRPKKSFVHLCNGSNKISGWFIDEKGRSASEIWIKMGKYKMLCKREPRYDVVSAFKEKLPVEPDCGFCLNYIHPRGIKKVFIEVKSQDGDIFILDSFWSLGFYWSLKKQTLNINGNYPLWVELHDTLSKRDGRLIESEIQKLRKKPIFSIVMPANDVTSACLRETIHAITQQTYCFWELYLYGSDAINEGIENIIKEYQNNSKNIYYVHNGGRPDVSELVNEVINDTKGSFVIFMNSDVQLRPHALYMVAEQINSYPEVKLIYTDEDQMDDSGKRSSPFFKTDWNPALFYSMNYMEHFVVLRKDLFESVSGLRTNCHGIHVWDLLLRVIEKINPTDIHHIPFILYHLRNNDKSLLEKVATRKEAEKRILTESFKRKGIDVNVTEHSEHYRINYIHKGELPFISIVMPSACKLKFVKPCLDSILSKTNYPHYEILLLVNECRYEVPEQKKFLDALKGHEKIRVLKYANEPFNFSKVFNWGVSNAKGDLIMCLNDDMEVIKEDWVEELAKEIIYGGADAVGAKLYYPNNTIQHGGVILGLAGIADHLYRWQTRNISGYKFRAKLIQDMSCVTGACMLMKKKVFEEVNGCDEAFTIAYNDVDLCLKIKAKGYRIVWSPFVELYHHESVSVGSSSNPARATEIKEAIGKMRARWNDALVKDPYYNPNLSLKGAMAFEYAFPPRVKKPWEKASFF